MKKNTEGVMSDAMKKYQARLEKSKEAQAKKQQQSQTETVAAENNTVAPSSIPDMALFEERLRRMEELFRSQSELLQKKDKEIEYLKAQQTEAKAKTPVDPRIKFIDEQAARWGLAQREHRFVTPFKQIMFNCKKKNSSKCFYQSVIGELLDTFIHVPQGGKIKCGAEAKTGKTFLIKELSKSCSEQAEAGVQFDHVYVVMFGERSEEGTELIMNLKERKNTTVLSVDYTPASASEILNPSESKVAKNMIIDFMHVIAQAQKDALEGKDVIVFIDSMTRVIECRNMFSSGSAQSGGLGGDVKQFLYQIIDTAHTVYLGDMNLPAKQLQEEMSNKRNCGSLTLFFTMLSDPNNNTSKIMQGDGLGKSNADFELKKDVLPTRTKVEKIDLFYRDAGSRISFKDLKMSEAMRRSLTERFNEYYDSIPDSCKTSLEASGHVIEYVRKKFGLDPDDKK